MQVTITGNEFEYEIKALLKAFYPNENQDIGLDVSLEKDKIGISFFKDEIPILKIETMVGETTRRGYKDVLKRFLYKGLAEVTQRTLPWGTLTGVRPTKLAMELVERGYSKEEAVSYMEEKYFTSREKALLGVEIAKREHCLLKELDYKNGYSLYIGIPFCPSTCAYCSFPSYALNQWKGYVDSYIQALLKEIEFASALFPEKKVSTVYFGGGTPTTLSADQLEMLIRKVRDVFPCSGAAEFTVEAGRPDSITKDKLRVLKENGVTRISINPQTMNQKTLDRIGRKHTVEQVLETFFWARQMGFHNINMDLIAGLSGENQMDMQRTLSCLKELKPDSLTVHSLVLKRAAALNREQKAYGQEEKNYDSVVEQMLFMGAEFAREEGLYPYYLYRQKNATGSGHSSRENVGYARKGAEGLYNILIMEEKQTILALGAGGSSKFVFDGGKRIERVENVKSITDYIGRIEEMLERKRVFVEREFR